MLLTNNLKYANVNNTINTNRLLYKLLNYLKNYYLNIFLYIFYYYNYLIIINKININI